MQLSEYENIYKNEGSHFFYVANHNIVLSFIKKYLRAPASKAKILDAGCGTGLLAKKMEQFGKVYGVESQEGIVNDILLWVLKIENSLLSFTNLPFGLGAVVVAQKPS